MTELIECVFVEVMSQTRKHKRKILVGIVYRPPNTSISAFTEQITNIVRTLRIENNQCYIMGDFNINLLNYDHHMETHDYVAAVFSNCLIPQITKPTRITPTTATLIDIDIFIVTTLLVNTINFKEYYIQVFLTIYQYLY